MFQMKHIKQSMEVDIFLNMPSMGVPKIGTRRTKTFSKIQLQNLFLRHFESLRLT